MLLELPFETLQIILTFLNRKELARLEITCSLFQELTRRAWYNLLKTDYLLVSFPSSSSSSSSPMIEEAKKEYYQIYQRFEVYDGVTIGTYQTIKRIWDRILDWVHDNDQQSLLRFNNTRFKNNQQANGLNINTDSSIEFSIPLQPSSFVNPTHQHKTAKKGETDSALTVVRKMQLPSDYLVSVIMVNGQEVIGDHGFFGTLESYGQRISSTLLSIEASHKIYVARFERFRINSDSMFRKLWPITLCRQTHRTHNMVMETIQLTDDLTLQVGQIVIIPSNSRYAPIIVANSFAEFLDTMITRLETHVYTLRGNTIIRYPETSPYITETVTNGVRVKGSAVYNPSSDRNTRLFFYRITISMDADEDPSRSCILISRHWDIRDGNDEINQVNGHAVIGQNPLIKPGTKFEYCSMCELRNDNGQMSGYFLMLPTNQNGTPYSAVPDIQDEESWEDPNLQDLLVPVIVPPFILTINQV
ncbi:cyclin-like F-box containing protein [Cavenderia fasciculata]|uniref:Cyclin-like F-box containing protein n=1 Tax=Cavenderia fasciculata TaxID=261658 RepID=F4PZJ0_CACFS|nr:cyclin-like F-box containing protein [Cavenderia fasciculata]EGG19219.1 cyclin-like F-box containing protein [Cavenderia fasciculata]|eukprot:XP_004366852.1 cyclin-like F-box containing protein [Cavenderia fasciculata]